MRSPLARLRARYRQTDPDHFIPWAVGVSFVLLAAAIVGVGSLGVGRDEAQAAEQVARVGPEVPLTDATYVTTLPGFDDLLIGCHEGVRVVLTLGGGNVPSNLAAVLDPTGCPR